MKICVVGTGYVGLVAGTCLSEMGNNVTCVDKDICKLQKLKNGIIPIWEPGLEELIKTNIKENRLRFTSDLSEAIKKSDVCFIAVGTPESKDGSADLKYVLEVAKNIAKAMNGYKVIVNKSTVPVGTAEKVTKLMKENTNHPFDVVSNPEFLKQGSAVCDFLSPERIIIGSNSTRATKIMQEIYSSFLRTSNRILLMDVKSAEMTKYAANSFLATKISFMNEIANLCEKVGANIDNVRIGMSTDSRIGNKFLFAGLGYGGSCFIKDVNALSKTGLENGCTMSILEATNNVNKKQSVLFLEKILDYFKGDVKNKTFAIWGLAFKPKTNDMREAPSIIIINKLLEKGAKVKAFDPKAMEAAKEIFENKIEYSKSSYETLKDADAMILITEWNEFRTFDFKKASSLMKNVVIFDGRNQYNAKEMKFHKCKYFCVGKSNK